VINLRVNVSNDKYRRMKMIDITNNENFKVYSYDLSENLIAIHSIDTKKIYLANVDVLCIWPKIYYFN